MKRYTYVILGCSVAAVAAVEGIRSRDREGSILVVGEEPCKAYGRPLISYYLLGETDLAHMDYRPEHFYEENDVALRLGVRAEKIDPEEKTVTLAGGEQIGYEKLLVATGSRPFEPPMEGIETVKERFQFMTKADALALDAALSPAKRVLIVGAGLIGLKCLEGIAARVKSAAIVDMADRILPSVLDHTAAEMVQKVLEAHGAEFYLSDSVEKFDGNTACLKSGKAVPFDILVTAVGVRPNAELVKEAGGRVRRGIAADAGGRTSLPDVFAAGDCAESFDAVGGENKVLALLPNANMQGRIAGINMAGGKDIISNLTALNIVPISISYEYDPCDYLKAQEFQLKRDNPDYQKTKHDDLLNMETGILGNKGRVHFTIGNLINDQLQQLDPAMDKNALFAAVASIIDREIYTHYRFYPCNYVAYDLLSGTRCFSSHYGPKDKKDFEAYLQGQLDKIQIPNKDEAFLRHKLLEMYTTPLNNHLALQG